MPYILSRGSAVGTTTAAAAALAACDAVANYADRRCAATPQLIPPSPVRHTARPPLTPSPAATANTLPGVGGASYL